MREGRKLRPLLLCFERESEYLLLNAGKYIRNLSMQAKQTLSPVELAKFLLCKSVSCAPRKTRGGKRGR